MMPIVFDDEVADTGRSRIVFDDAPQAQPSPPKSDGVLSQFMRGVRELPQAIVDIPSTVLSSVLAPPASQLYGVAKNVLSGTLGTQEGIDVAEKARQQAADALTYRPRSAAIATAKDMIGSAIAPVAPAFPAVLGEMQAFAATPRVPTMPKEAPKPAIHPEIAAQAAKFQDMGGKVPAHTLSENQFVRMTGDWLNDLPLTFSPDAANKQVINREVLRQIGGDEKQGLVTPGSFGPAMEKSGQTIGALYNKTNVPISSINLGAVKADLPLHTADVSNVLTGFMDRLENVSGASGAVSGRALHELDQKLGFRIRGTNDPLMRGALSDLQETIRDALATQLSPEDAATLNTVRTQYAKGKLIEPLVAKNQGRGISPSEIMGRELSTAAGKHRMAIGAAGELGDLATIGDLFLKDTSSKWRKTFGNPASAIAAIPGMVAGAAYNVASPTWSRSVIDRSITPREKLGYSKVESTPESSLAVLPASDAWRYERPFQSPGPQESGLLSIGSPPEQPARGALTMSAVDYPRQEPTVTSQNAFYQNKLRSDALAQEAAQRAHEEANRAPTGRGTAFDLDPITGRLRPVSQGLKGATPDVIESTGHTLASAVDKLSRGEPATMTQAEKVAWEHTRVDFNLADPGMRGLSERAILGKMMDRQWVEAAIAKARERAQGFDEIAKRASDAQKIRDAATNRERMLDFADTLDAQIRGGRPETRTSQGPKTREAIRQGILSQRPSRGVLSGSQQ